MHQDMQFKSTKYLIIGILGVIVLVGGFGTWSALTPIAGAVIAQGQIEVDQNRQVVQHPEGGVVQDILVTEGQRVDVDQVLIRLYPSKLETELAIVESQLFELMARRGRLEAERDGLANPIFDPLLNQVADTNQEALDMRSGQHRLFVARRTSLDQQINQLAQRQLQIRGRITGIEAQQNANTLQLDLIREELDSQQELLDKGLAQATRVLSLRRELARLIGVEGELTAQKSEAEENITEIDIETLRLRSTRREEAIEQLRELRVRELELREQRQSLSDQLSRMEIRAPVAGVVYGLAVFAKRSVIRPADPVMFLVPQDRPLVIGARIEPIHVDLVAPGQDVIMRLSSLDQRQTPEVNGRIEQVSADAFADEASGLSFYRARVTLNPGELDKLPDGVVLLPGMPVEAFILTSEHTPLQYLFKPFLDYFAKAFRET